MKLLTRDEFRAAVLQRLQALGRKVRPCEPRRAPRWSLVQSTRGAKQAEGEVKTWKERWQETYRGIDPDAENIERLHIWVAWYRHQQRKLRRKKRMRRIRRRGY